MRHSSWGALAVTTVLVSCSFSAQELDPGSSLVDASIPIFDAQVIDGDVIDGPLADAPDPDAASPDAEVGTPDAQPDQCLGGSATLPLSTTFATFATPVGNDSDPSCADADNLDSAFRVDLAPTVTSDFVVDIAETPDDWDSVVDVSSDCANGAGTACSDLTNGGHGELVVVPSVSAGRRYVTVDTYANDGDAGAYQLRAFLRPVRGVATATRTCDPAIVTSRCDETSYCLDLDDMGGARCEESMPVPDVVGNIGCGSAATLTSDGVFAGTSSAGSFADDDFIVLDPAGSGKFGFRATVYTPNGGCAADLRLEARQGADCDDLGGVLAEDDDSGLGACPALLVQEAEGEIVSLRVFRRTYLTNPATSYSVVIDFF